MPKLIYNAIKTPDGTVLVSTYRHDYRTHLDANGKTYMIDGGLAYSRRSMNGDEVDLCLYDDAPHEIQRNVLKWGSFGIEGDQPLTYHTISEMSTGHIKAVLRECLVSPSHKNCMEAELKYRGEDV